MSNAPAVHPATSKNNYRINHYFPALESIISGLTIIFGKEVYTRYKGIEEYLISVINGPIGVYPGPPHALDKYPEFTIDEAQLAEFKSSMTSESVFCFGDIVRS